MEKTVEGLAVFQDRDRDSLDQHVIIRYGRK